MNNNIGKNKLMQTQQNKITMKQTNEQQHWQKQTHAQQQNKTNYWTKS